MNLAIDIGNKRIKIGIFERRKILKFYSHLTSQIEDFDFSNIFKNLKIEKCGISSVVPEVNNIIEKKVEKYFEIKPLFLNYENSGIKVKVKNPEKIGIDRIVNSKGAIEIFGYPVCIVDIGTATTIDVVDNKKYFIGGFILPGPELWTFSLKRTSQIKGIEKSKSKFIGKDTSSAIYNGLKYGLSGAIERIVNELKKRFINLKIVLTGGYSNEFKKFLNFDYKLRKYLTLEGINIILGENEEN